VIHLAARLHALLHGLFRPGERAAALELHGKVERMFRQRDLATEDDRKSLAHGIAEDVIDVFERPPAAPDLQSLSKLILRVFDYEEMFVLPRFDWSERHSIAEYWEVRDTLNRQRALLEDLDGTRALITLTFARCLDPIVSDLPASLRPDHDDDGIPVAIDLIRAIGNIGKATEAIIGAMFDDAVERADLFPRHRSRLEANLIMASGGNPADPRGFTRAPKFPSKSDIDDPRELVATYLGGTPIGDLFEGSIPFLIPTLSRFEHHHIIAGTGHGKTQTLQHLIMHDLTRPEHRRPGLVIIDSQGDMLSKLIRLDLFDPDHGTLADQLIVIDPTDVEHPPALGLFDLNLARVDAYDARYREQIMNGVIELYDYIFGGLLGAELTQKQSVIFRYLARLMLAIPDATILTLKDVMYDSAPFAPNFDKLDGMARDFFLHEFNDRQFAETKKQILRRLWGVLENPTFERLFSNPRNRIDMFEALNSGKIVLVNTAKDFLKAERSSILGRFFIALTFQAALERAAIPERQRRPAFLYIDEAADYFDDQIDSLLTQARKFKLGVVFAHQYLDQLSHGLRASIMTNTSIKFAGGVSSTDAGILAPNMHTSREFIAATRKRRSETDFAAHIRNVTESAVTLTLPFGSLEAAPKMSADAYDRLIDANRTRYAASPEQARETAADSDAPQPHETEEASTAEPMEDDWRS
jgi:hypothetical protein